MPLIHLFENKKDWNHWHNWLLSNWSRLLNWKIGDWWVVVQKIYSEMHPVSYTNTRIDVTGLVNHGMVKKTKTWKSWERNITFLRNKKIFNLSFRWHILRSYGFEADVTVNVKIYYYLELSNYYSFLLLNVNCYNSKFVITN